MSSPYNQKIHNVEINLGHLKKGHDLVKWSENELKRQLQELVSPSLKIGTVMDTSKLGLAYDAMVMRGRGYGFHFRIESEVKVDITTGHPSLSKWGVHAISVDPEDHTRTLGKPVWLKGYIFPRCIVDIPFTDDERVLKGMAVILAMQEAASV